MLTHLQCQQIRAIDHLELANQIAEYIMIDPF